MAPRHRAREQSSQDYAGPSKVPAVKPYFWVVKLLTTAMGEAVSDFVVLDWNKYVGVVMGFVVFAVAMLWQFRTPRYRTWPYWVAVAMVAVFGTMAADVMHVVLGLPYMVSAVFCAVCLIVTFVTWYRTEGTLDIHSIVTRRREVFYWLAVVFTFAMGTALGDLFATTFHLGYLASAFLFVALICVPLVAWRLGANPVLTFWVAYVLTRPIGASFADFFGMPKYISGMGYGHAAVSVVTLIMVVASFIYLSRSGIDEPGAVSAAGPAAFAGYGEPQYARARYAQPRYYGDPGPRQPTNGQPRYYRDPRQSQAQYRGEPQQGQPPYYRDTRRRQPTNGQPQYYGDPRRRQPTNGQPRYTGDPRQSQPQYYRDPRQNQPQYYRDPRQNQPQHRGEPRQAQPRYNRDPQHGQPPGRTTGSASPASPAGHWPPPPPPPPPWPRSWNDNPRPNDERYPPERGHPYADPHYRESSP